jgi:FkbM family methyltransferase
MLALMRDPRAVAGLLTWPVFSVTSYRMLRRLVGEGIVPATVIDVGANVGQFTVTARKSWPAAVIHAFEPHPACYRRLARNVSRLAPVHLYETALGDQPGNFRFFLNAFTHSSSVLQLGEAHLSNFPHAREIEIIYVPMTTLDLAFGSAELAAPILLKIDVQGNDHAVLRGGLGLLARIQWVVIELSFETLYHGESLFSDVVRWMDDHGFAFHRPVGVLESPRTGVILQADALFVRKP